MMDLGISLKHRKSRKFPMMMDLEILTKLKNHLKNKRMRMMVLVPSEISMTIMKEKMMQIRMMIMTRMGLVTSEILKKQMIKMKTKKIQPSLLLNLRSQRSFLMRRVCFQDL